MKCALAFLFLFGISLSFISTRRVEFYRRDYTYVAQYNAFYKMHWSDSGYSWDAAFQACDEEESTLFYPKLEKEWNIAHNLTLALKDTPNVSDIFVGVHDKFGFSEFITVDGYSFKFEPKDRIENPDETCVTMNINNGKYGLAPCTRFPYTPLPFICKKNDYEYCPTIDPGYKYVKSLKKCYKINKRGKTWEDALRTCHMEGGMLIVLQNKGEADTIRDLVERDDKYHAGIKRIHRYGNFYAINGQNIDNVYYKRYITSYPEQNNQEDNSYDCNALYIRDDINIINITCNTKLPFICEMNTGLMLTHDTDIIYE